MKIQHFWRNADENGINTASGIGHDIVAILDGDETNPYILNDYYIVMLTATKVEVWLSFRNLSQDCMHYTKAWDVYNNASTKGIQFVVFRPKSNFGLQMC